VPLTIKHSRGRLLMVDTPSLATTLGRNLSHALGVVHAHASHTEVQAAVGAMLPPRVLSLGPLVPGRVGPVTDPVLREVVVKRQQVGRGTRGSGVCVCVCTSAVLGRGMAAAGRSRPVQHNCELGFACLIRCTSHHQGTQLCQYTQQVCPRQAHPPHRLWLCLPG
jgi:hypothetical protein